MAGNRIVRSRTFNRGGTRKRQTEWAICSVPTGYTVVAAGAKAILVSVPAVTLAQDSPSTVVRFRGVLSVRSDQAGASEDQIGAFGVGFINEVAGALGVTGTPGPASECSWGGWFVHRFFTQRWQFISGVGVDAHVATQYELDSKAMRKFTEDERLMMVIENFGADGIAVALSFRLLLKAG